jgi:hypothetical protein
LFSEPIKTCIYVYTEWQKAFEDKSIGDITFTSNILEIENHYLENDYIMVILDDMFIRMTSDSSIQTYITELFTQKSHHKKVVPVLITHSLFSPAIRTVSLNTQIFILLRQLRDKLTYTYFARQIYPNKPKFILEALEDATKDNAFGYICLDLNVRSHNNYRCRNFIIPHDDMKVYIP